MALELDDRQRAMLQEMGVRVWLPDMASVPSVVLLQTPSDDAASAANPGAARVAQQDRAPSFTPVHVAVSSAVAQLSAGSDSMDLQSLDAQALARSAAACQACALCAGRKNSTLLAFDPQRQTDWLFLGDPPDEDEDRLGQAFAAQTGQLLDNMLRAVGASRSGQGRAGAYLSNVVKCRPPSARLPQASELAQCAHYLHREMELVQPKVMVAMGRFAAQLLLQDYPLEAALPLGKQRGRVYQYRGVAVVVSYHPKVLLRASADKAKAWADLCLAMDVLDGKTASLQ